MARHLPSVSWSLDRARKRGWVMTMPENTIGIRVVVDDWWQVDGPLIGLELDRATARLLARRILQCLEDSK